MVSPAVSNGEELGTGCPGQKVTDDIAAGPGMGPTSARIIVRQTGRGLAHTSCKWPLRFQPAPRLRSVPMSFPVPTRTAVWALPYALGMATLVVGRLEQGGPP